MRGPMLPIWRTTASSVVKSPGRRVMTRYETKLTTTPRRALSEKRVPPSFCATSVALDGLEESLSERGPRHAGR